MVIFVGNLSFSSGQDDVKKLFQQFGAVSSVFIVMSKDKKVPKSRGFAFVEMPDEQAASNAISGLNGKEFMGRILDISPSRPKTLDGQQPGAEAGSGRPVEGKTQQEQPFFRPGSYKGGRRSQNYLKRQRLAEIQEESRPRQPGYLKAKKNRAMPWKKTPEAEGISRDRFLPGRKPWNNSQEHTAGEGRKGSVKSWGRPAEYIPREDTKETKPGNMPEGRSLKSRKKVRPEKTWKQVSRSDKPWRTKDASKGISKGKRRHNRSYKR